MDRYGEAIAADLADRGFDLELLWEDQRFDFILAIVDRLPRNSAYMQELTDDDAWAEAVLARPDSSKGKPSVRLADWSAELEMLTNLYDRMGELIRVVAMSAGSRPKRAPPAPRPTTALDRVADRRNQARHDRLKAGLLPQNRSGAPAS
ncbi:hypothetical protein E1091_01125 [Micromonospora fluostatini]|uniref:Uncharacterized protein n=1 Tax=Micromonospora fluostatini TaxID=1629071 RepID=A0ABY2DLT1_9ACTN|nr:hypothetical protein E1091_01125 [Micromonospora fluostatini]